MRSRDQDISCTETENNMGRKRVCDSISKVIRKNSYRQSSVVYEKN